MYIDSHAHFDISNGDTDLAALIDRARLARVHRILAISSGFGPGSFNAAIRLAEKYEGIDASVGIHPHEARLATENDFEILRDLASHPKVVAWGEIGLDYYYTHSGRDVQRAVFARQIELATQVDLPVIIHTRDAEDETREILASQVRKRKLQGVMHSYSGSLEMALYCLERGFLISFSGMITFPKAQNIRDVALQVPLERMLIETDSPYLAPVPHRGKRNEPAFIVETAKALAHLKGVSVEELARCTAENYCQLFRRSDPGKEDFKRG